MAHERDPVARPDPEMRLADPQRLRPARQAQPLLADDGLRLGARLGQSRAEQPDIQPAGLLVRLAQDLSSGVPPVFNAASAAKGEFSTERRGALSGDRFGLPPGLPPCPRGGLDPCGLRL